MIGQGQTCTSPACTRFLIILPLNVDLASNNTLERWLNIKQAAFPTENLGLGISALLLPAGPIQIESLSALPILCSQKSRVAVDIWVFAGRHADVLLPLEDEERPRIYPLVTAPRRSLLDDIPAESSQGALFNESL